MNLHSRASIYVMYQGLWSLNFLFESYKSESNNVPSISPKSVVSVLLTSSYPNIHTSWNKLITQKDNSNLCFQTCIKAHLTCQNLHFVLSTNANMNMDQNWQGWGNFLFALYIMSLFGLLWLISKNIFYSITYIPFLMNNLISWNHREYLTWAHPGANYVLAMEHPSWQLVMISMMCRYGCMILIHMIFLWYAVNHDNERPKDNTWVPWDKWQSNTYRVLHTHILAE